MAMNDLVRDSSLASLWVTYSNNVTAFDAFKKSIIALQLQITTHEAFESTASDADKAWTANMATYLANIPNAPTE